MKTVNSISGGRTSGLIHIEHPADYDVFALVCIEDIRCRPKDAAVIRYVNDKLQSFAGEFGEFIATAEDDATITALMDLEQLSGRPITWVRGRSFEKVITEPRLFGGTMSRLPGKQFRTCTEEMKLIPIFLWWLQNIGERVEMRIGFRRDEMRRIYRFYNDGNPSEFHFPASQSLKGMKRQKWEFFKWRFCTMPLLESGTDEEGVRDYWKGKPVNFPEVSNCVGCFWKKVETLSIMAAMNPEKMQWFADQETIGKGTWVNGIDYQTIINNSAGWIPEMLKAKGTSCDSGGCTD